MSLISQYLTKSILDHEGIVAHINKWVKKHKLESIQEITRAIITNAIKKSDGRLEDIIWKLKKESDSEYLAKFAKTHELSLCDYGILNNDIEHKGFTEMVSMFSKIPDTEMFAIIIWVIWDNLMYFREGPFERIQNNFQRVDLALMLPMELINIISSSQDRYNDHSDGDSSGPSSREEEIIENYYKTNPIRFPMNLFIKPRYVLKK
jgi:hypothetical protein